jgi:hypothetical protein
MILQPTRIFWWVQQLKPRAIEYEGKKYPYVTLDISSASHPFYTGEQRVSKKMAVYLNSRIASAA